MSGNLFQNCLRRLPPLSLVIRTRLTKASIRDTWMISGVITALCLSRPHSPSSNLSANEGLTAYKRERLPAVPLQKWEQIRSRIVVLPGPLNEHMRSSPERQGIYLKQYTEDLGTFQVSKL
ncbi:hypothetical protein BDW67DRAFT_25233 [Aspergillus spinulosporus]